VIAAHRDAAVIHAAASTLADLSGLSRSLRHVAVVTDDGFEVVRRPETAPSDGRLASMASSIQALTDAIAYELQLGTAKSVIIASETGHVIQMRVPGYELVMVALFDENETIGMALSMLRVAAERLAAVLDAASVRSVA
jgi:predicted regulator of Ras-like GTPase activity (Roadblock/LC7/MglB family)